MAMAEGVSRIRIGKMQPHTEAALYVLGRLCRDLPIEFENGILSIQGPINIVGSE
jgi:hypothetical protein